MEYAKDYSGENFLHQKDLILSEWEKRLRIEFSDFGKLPQSVLRNSIPEFLERISKSLVDKNSKKIKERGIQSGKEHVAHRIKYESTSLSLIIREYQVLRQTIFSIEESRLKNDFEAVKITLASFEAAIKEAVENYSSYVLTKERQEDEEKIRKLMALIEGSDDLIGLLDINLHFIYINKSGTTWLGQEKQDSLSKKSFFEFLIEKDIEKLKFRNGDFWHWKGELSWKSQNSDRILHSFTTFFTINDNTSNLPIGYACVARDITPLIKNKELLEVTIRNLNDEKTIREQFVRGLAHDLRTHVAIAKMSTEFIRRKTQDELTLKNSSRIIDSLNMLEKMIQNILDANKISSGQKLSLNITEVNLHEVCHNIIEKLKIVHGNRFSLQCDQKITGNWDKSYIERILENLLTNAIKYGSATTEISVLAEDFVNSVKLCVHNYGSFIPQDKKESIFKLFSRMDNASAVSGWGIGLTLVKGLIESHHGTIDVESFAESGTSFIVTLPKKF